MATSNSQLTQQQRHFVAGVSLALSALGATVLFGWIVDSELLKSFGLSHVAMKPNAAIGFLLIGAMLAAACQPSGVCQLVSSIAAAVLASLGLATIYEFAAQVDLGIDQCLGLSDATDAASLFPGRMAPGTAAHFLILGVAQLCRFQPHLNKLCNALAGLSCFAAILPIASYLFSAGSGNAFPPYAAMAVHTAIGLAIGSLGVWVAAAPNGFPQQFFASSLVGQITRCLLPMAVALPLLIGVLVFAFRRLAEFDINFGLAIMTVGNIVLSSLLCAWSARHIAESVSKHREAEIALNESRERLKAEAEQRRNLVRERVIEQTLLAREEEQRRIARDLHDGLGQLLTSLRFGISGIENAASLTVVQERLPLLRSQVASGQAEIRRIINDLRPSTLDELGLAPALGRLTAEFARDHNVRIILDAGEVGQTRLPQPQETAIFRIVQESLNNIARHAAASEVAVTIKRHDSRVELSVSDNGRGIGASQCPAEGYMGFGLLSMSERATMLHGDFRVGPLLPQGTIVEVDLPLA